MIESHLVCLADYGEKGEGMMLSHIQTLAVLLKVPVVGMLADNPFNSVRVEIFHHVCIEHSEYVAPTGLVLDETVEVLLLVEFGAIRLAYVVE